jgi:hypothetical protein
MSTRLDYSKLFDCLLKRREEMERDIPGDKLGWWHDCVPGENLELRQATQTDMDKSWVRPGATRDPDDYMITLDGKGCLILKKAIKRIKEKA